MDYRAASQLLQSEDPIREAVAFHCQQTAEKYIKAFLVRHQVEFPKTHNLRRLLDLLSEVAPELAKSLEGAAVLTPYGVDIRYPGDFPDVLPGQEKTIYKLVGQVRDAILMQLSSYLKS